jgi:para-nitrobenzyl esterase
MAMYPADTAEQKRNVMNLFLTDTMFLAPTRATVRAMSTVNSNAYLYQFTRKQQTGRLKAFGAFHGSEIPYVFNSSGPSGSREEDITETDRKLADAMITYWAQFAKTGDPNGTGLPEWPVYDAASDQHLELGDTIQVGSGLRKEVCDALDRIVAARLHDLEGSK